MKAWRRTRAIIAGIVVAGAVIRLALGWWRPGVVHPDETLQYLEQAYRLVTGRGLVPWEYQVGARSWLLPGMMVPVVVAVRLVSADPIALRGAVALLGVAVAAVGIVAAAAIGGRLAGRAGAIWAAAIAALWPELVGFGPHVLADSVAAVLLIAGIAAVYRCKPRAGRSVPAGPLLEAGLLLGLTLVVRPQLAPAVAVAALGVAGRPGVVRYGALAIGGAVAVALYGVVDWVSWGRPFVSIITYLRVNAGGVADTFGRAPLLAYVRGELAVWGWAAVPVLATAVAGARRAPLIAAVALVVAVTFSSIGHKEYRFVYPALPLLFLLCGIGTAALVARAQAARWRAAPAIAAAAWLLAASVAATAPAMRGRLATGSAVLAALDAIDRDTGVCGVGLAPATYWAEIGASRLRDDVGLYDAGGDRRAFNTLLLLDPAAVRRTVAGYGPTLCFAGDAIACVRRRPGGCRAGGATIDTGPSPAVAAVLMREKLMP